ncbi:hypothetical protein KAFR_0G00970 [Kazachstania africana CBS 2517]|uniref:F-box domain-containing protein n=1 Tax=Kazachstania africana (strain ATCC 22294 / BCRC 22015 / CBS 2517 / CECT 1963 / NBRC 1671 / NRRL Y-8276) TaxID=1071382 RepID=H2AXN0_KAZAF|nr:hypothetical protein KAFR_0G00970 [Kazachstania africana CBS 2517]CCF59130.1 hypothetical protein KAFR_0G00970 [Kazachstania africana CBS 2517]
MNPNNFNNRFPFNNLVSSDPGQQQATQNLQHGQFSTSELIPDRSLTDLRSTSNPNGAAIQNQLRSSGNHMAFLRDPNSFTTDNNNDNNNNNVAHSLQNSSNNINNNFINLSQLNYFSDDSFSNLDPSDLETINLFQIVLQEKVENFLNEIENRRHAILDEIELDNMKLRQMELAENATAMNFLNKLQCIRLRAIEVETMELQKLRIKIMNIVEEYKRAMVHYSKAKAEGKNVENPTDKFYNWVDTLVLNDASHLTDGLQEVSNYSRQLVQTLQSEMFKPNASSNTSSLVFPLHRLPSEILHLVLDKLNSKSDTVNLLTVCKLWALIIVKILYYRPHINKKQQLDLFLRTMKLHSNRTVFNYRLMIKRLNFSFVGDYIHDDELHYFIGCNNLERLTLVFCKHITSGPVSEILKGCKFLQSVDITGIKEVKDNVFNTLADGCPRVQGFYVPVAKAVSFQALNNFVLHAPMLKRVKITSSNTMNDELLNILSDKCPMLVEVDITDCPNVHDDSLLKMFSKLTQLREFRITHNMNITDKLFVELSKSLNMLPSLRLIDLSNCENFTDKTVEKIVDLAPKLRNIFLGKCSRITDNSLFHLARLGKNLQTVHFGHCFNITDQGVRVLVQSCPRIQYVDFACCTNLTNRTLYELSDLSKLKRIGLVKCSQMTDEGLLNMISLRGRNDSLERVHLSYCSNLTIYPIYELLMACPRLSHLSLTAVPSFLRPDITQFCRPAPSDFSDNQRQIFCVFSGKGVHKLRHYLMSLTTPTNGPQTDINEVLSKYIVSHNLLQSNEGLETGISRITGELNQDSAAILAAAGLSHIPGLTADMTFQNINFERLDEVFSWYDNTYKGELSINKDELNNLMSLVDKKFIEDPFNSEYDDIDPEIAAGANRDLNSDMCHIVRRFHELDEHIDDFEVNVASLARVQYQFTGFLLHEMAQTFIQMVELNRLINLVQDRVYEAKIERDLKGLYIWRILFADKFTELLHKFKISTVVLRLYLKDSIMLLTRQREIALANERNVWNNTETNNNNINLNMNLMGAIDESNNDNATANNFTRLNDPTREGVGFWQQLGERVPLTADQMRIIQFGIRNPQNDQNDQNLGQDVVSDVQMEDRSETPDEEEEA